MTEITLQPISVLTDGGSREGRLIMAGTDLVAVFIRVTAEEDPDSKNQAPGWFMEAGFGPCSSLMTLEPPVFHTLERAVEWVRQRLEAGFTPS